MKIHKFMMSHFPHREFLIDRNGRITYANKRRSVAHKERSFTAFHADITAGITPGRKETLGDKREGIGTFAGATAHDFNSLLTKIAGYASLMRKRLTEGDELARYAEIVESSAKEAALLGKRLLSLPRERRKPHGKVNVNSLLNDILFLLGKNLQDIAVQRDFDVHMPSIRGNEAELNQVFLHLCVTAREAMGEKGTLQVTTKREKQPGGRGFAVIEIGDTGRGIDEGEGHKHNSPEPSFSAREREEGAGIGLYITQVIIADHKGLMEIDHRKDGGTAVRVYLPLEARVTEKV